MDMPPPPPRAPPAAKQQQPEDDLSWAVTPPPPFHALEHFKDGSLAGTTTLDKKVITIGRDADADLTILHPTASRRHASIINGEDRQLFLVAKDTRYGTTLNGQTCAPGAKLKLDDGAQIRFALSSRTYVVKLATARDPSQTPLAEAALPTSFGRREKVKETKPDNHQKRKADGDADAARQALAERRAKRKAEIDAMTRDMVSSTPSYTAPVVAEEEPEEEEEEEEATDADAVAALTKRWQLPVSHEARLQPASKAVSAIASDPAGGRVIVGSLDYKVRLYDFGGMDRRHRPFREIEPDEGHPVVALSYSPTGDRFLCCTGSAQPKIFQRDGQHLLTFNRGDPYVTDMARTTGHVTIVTGGQWHPHEKMQCLTSGMDGSLRIWDLCGKTGLRDFLLCDHTIRVRDKGARKIAATACCYSPDGRKVACGAADGSVQIWQLKGRAHNYLRPDACARTAHRPSTDASGAVVSCVQFSPDGRSIASRADDGFIRVWDVRKLSKSQPVCEFAGIEPRGLTANLAWRPDGAVLCAGAAGANKNDPGRLSFFSVGGDAHEVHRDAGGYRPLVSLGGCAKGADVCVLWHERIRHVFVGGSDGSVRALYDPQLSKNGALLSVKRDHAPRKFLTSDTSHVDASSIVNPNALPMYRNDDAFRSRGRYAKTRNSQTLSKKPDPPLAQGQQGRNEGARTTFCQTFLENELAQGPGNIRNEDPREALLKYANEEPIFRTNATFYRDSGGARRDLAQDTLEAAESKFVEDQKQLMDRNPSRVIRDARKKPDGKQGGS
jgi:pSer/pThr/pTyr-binding forkhead associated (FHA) protein